MAQWEIKQGDATCPFEVVNDETDERDSCHKTMADAEARVEQLNGETQTDSSMSEHDMESMMQRAGLRPQAPLEQRDDLGSVGSVDFKQRVVTVVAVPYEQAAKVPFQGDVWDEVFQRGAFDNISTSPHRVRANRNHNKSQTVGKVVQFYPDRVEGLIADIRIAKTPLGDETLALAADDCLSSSIGFAALPQWQKLDRRNKIRRIENAYLDHISFVESPAYENADVIAVRETMNKNLRNNPQLVELLVQLLAESAPEKKPSPTFDQYTDDPMFRWADERLNKQ